MAIDLTTEATWSQDARKAYHDAHPENFAGPDLSFPIRDASDIADCVRLYGHAENPEQVKHNIIRIATRLGFASALPDDWRSNDGNNGKERDTTEALAANPSFAAAQEPFNPKPRVATFTVVWIEDDAISLNGRQYPRETVDKLIASAQLRLADPAQPPMTCYISHNASDQDNTMQLVGKITRVWREGSKGLADIDVPDTSAGRDVAALVAHRYIVTQSLRATGVETQVQRGRGIPQVMERPGDSAQLQGIDFTSTPGLDQTARIQRVMLEASKLPGLSEAFEPSITSLSQEQETSTMKESNAIAPQASGVTQGTDGSATQDQYGAQNYQTPPVAMADTMPDGVREAMQESHDRIASAMKMECAPAGGVKEAGRAFSKENAAHLGKAHDKLAEALNIPCKGKGAVASQAQGADSSAASDQAQQESTTTTARATAPVQETHQENTPMTEEEALKVLQSKGYSLHPPKSEAEKIQEAVDAKLAAEREAINAQFEALKQMLTAQATQASAGTVREQSTQTQATQETQPVQRRGVVEGAATTEAPRAHVYMANRMPYIREQMTEADLVGIADRTRPFPKDVQPERLLKELSVLLLSSYDHRYGLEN